MTAEEFLALGQTQARHELIQGVVMTSPRPRPRHWKATFAVLVQLGEFERSGGRVDVYGETDLRVHDAAVFRPDICVYAAAPDGIPDTLTRVPDLVIEVLSPGTKGLDLITKREEYERAGVKEYWVVDPEADAQSRVRAWRRDGDALVKAPVQGESLPSSAIAGFTLDLGRIDKALGV
jgi:Uma2 family endonuclease